MPAFTAESARIAAAKSWAPASARFKPEPDPALASQPADEYQASLRVKTRIRLDKVGAEIDSALAKRPLDHRRLKELALVQNILAEQERKLSMRPDPGTVKPAKERTSRRSLPVAPTPIASRPPAQSQAISAPVEPVQTPEKPVESTPPVDNSVSGCLPW